MSLSDELIFLLQSAVQSVFHENEEILLENPKHASHGDISCPVAMKIGKKQQQNPREVAQKILDALPKNTLFSHAEIAGPGFLNFTFSDAALEKALLQNNLKISTRAKKRKKIVIDFSHPNIAKPLHFGHFRSTVIGESLSRILRFCGHDVVSDNFLGDWGTNFGKLIVAIEKWGDRKKIAQQPMQQLVALYQLFHKKISEMPEKEKEAAEVFRQMEQEKNEKYLKEWKWIVEVAKKELQKFYDRLGTHFDKIRGEHFYEPFLAEIIATLERENIARRGEGGALVVDFDVLPTMIFQKGDGATLYQTRDLARIFFYQQHKVDQLVYVVSHEQNLHFRQVFATAKKMGFSTECLHISYGMVLGEDGKKFSTRKGNAVGLWEVLDEAAEKTREKLEDYKNDFSHEEKNILAEMIGLGALKFNDLGQNRKTDIVFSWEKMLDFNGYSAPFLQYSAARCHSLLEKAGKREKVTNLVFKNNTERELAIILLRFPEMVSRSAELFEPHHTAQYLFELASAFNRFYASGSILEAKEKNTKHSRLFLTEKTGEILKTGLGLLGIETPKRM